MSEPQRIPVSGGLGREYYRRRSTGQIGYALAEDRDGWVAMAFADGRKDAVWVRPDDLEEVR